MANETNLKVDGLEYSDIRANLLNYLKSQTEFQDYNFEASGLSSLLDLLAYNSYHNAFYTNMAAAESFLSTAQKRSSVVKHANTLGYTPRSTTSAKLPGTLTVTPSGTPAAVNIPYGTLFSTIIDGTTFNFTNTEALTITPTTGVYSLSGITLFEGLPTTEKYTYLESSPNQRFLINNTNADTSTLRVRVVNSLTDSTTRTFVAATSVINLTSESLVYYLSEVEDGKYEVKFGQGTLGKSLDDGNVVYLDYVVSSGASGNGVLNVNLKSSVSGVISATYTATAFSSGGENAESVESVKFNAPKTYASQNRAVTAEDYSALISQQANVSSVLVWGGEDNDPPAYGKVYIAVRPSVGEVLTPTEKQNLISNVINPKKVLTVSTEIVDPEYIFLTLDVVTTYDPEQTISTESNIKEVVANSITLYNSQKLNQFSRYFRYSELSRQIDTSERSILSSDLTVKMRKEFDVQLNSSAKYEINFSNPINSTTEGRPASHPYNVGNQITSNSFSYGGFTNCYLEDNAGLIRIFRLNESGDALGVAQNVGTINYVTGKITLDDFQPTAIGDGGVTLRITAVPANRDILPLRGQIVVINDSDVTVSLVNDKTVSLVNR